MKYRVRYWPYLMLLLLFWLGTQHSAGAQDQTPGPEPNSSMEQGLEALDAGKWDSAITTFQALADSHPKDPKPAYYLGIAAAITGQDLLALDAFTKVERLDPSYGWVQANLGFTFYRLGEIPQAEDHLLEALLQGPDDADVLLHLGMIDAQNQEYDRAIRLFEQSAELDPEMAAMAMYQAANIELDRANLPTALEFLERARLAPGPASSREAAKKLLAALAAESLEPKRYNLRADAGFELNDNVTLTSQDLATGLSDEALLLTAGLDIYLLREETAWLAVGYDLYQSLYRTLTDFDWRLQEPRLTMGGRIGRIYPTFTYAYLNATLGSNGFLTSHEMDFDVQVALWGSWSAVLGGGIERIAFDETPERTGYLSTLTVGHSIGFLDDHLSVSLAWEPSWDRTDGPKFSYDGQSISAQIGAFIPRGRGLALSATYEYAQRDYLDPKSASEQGYRHDVLHIFWTDLSMPLSNFAEISVRYFHLDSNSNLAALNYSQNILTFRLGFWH